MNDRENKNKTDHEGLFIPVKHVALVVIGFFSILCVVFFGGYFIGKKHVMEQLVAQLEQDSFADQVYASLCELYDYEGEQAEDVVADQTDRTQALVDEQADDAHEALFSPLPVAVAHDGTAEDQNDSSDQVQVMQEPALPLYTAQLIGYQSKRYADMFVKKLEKKNVPALVKMRKSITARGKTKEWYQVVTKPYADRQELQELVDRISREEKIKGARIITC